MVYADIASQHSKPKRYTACLLAVHLVAFDFVCRMPYRIGRTNLVFGSRHVTFVQ